MSAACLELKSKILHDDGNNQPIVIFKNRERLDLFVGVAMTPPFNVLAEMAAKISPAELC
jgi:hypothetical protein